MNVLVCLMLVMIQPGRPEPPLFNDDYSTVREVRLRREKLALSPVFYTALQAPELTNGLGVTLATSAPLQQPKATAALPSGFGMFSQTGVISPSNGDGTDKLGYLKLTSFSQNAADDLHRAIADLEVSWDHLWLSMAPVLHVTVKLQILNSYST